MRIGEAIALLLTKAGPGRVSIEQAPQREAVEVAEVVSVLGDGHMIVRLDDEERIATPVTDEPIFVGYFVWVSRTATGIIVHGAVK
jgi:hypothetical protein